MTIIKKSRKGRVRKVIVREPNGRASRKREESPNKVALDARKKLHGLGDKDAKDPRCASVIGILCMNREISQAQYEAAVQYEKICSDLHYALSSPKQLQAIDYNRGVLGASSGSDNEKAKQDIIERYNNINSMLKHEQMTQRNNFLISALDHFILKDKDSRHALGDLRLALNALVRFYKIK